MIKIEANGVKIEIPAGCENAAGLVSAVIAQLSGNGKSAEAQTPEKAKSPEGLISEEEAVRRERAAVEKARRLWKAKAPQSDGVPETRKSQKSQKSRNSHENHEIITRDENVIMGEECVIECESELININKNINKNIHSNTQSINTCRTQRSLAKVVKPRKCETRREADNSQYLLDFMYELPEEWQTEKVQQAWKVFVEEFTDFRHSSSRPKRQHTKEELLGILDILRFAYARQGEQGLLDTIWQAVETQRRYVWDLPNSCRNTTRQRPQTPPERTPPEPEPEPEPLTLEEQITFQKEQVEFYRSLGMTDLRKSAEEKLRELTAGRE